MTADTLLQQAVRLMREWLIPTPSDHALTGPHSLSRQKERGHKWWDSRMLICHRQPVSYSCPHPPTMADRACYTNSRSLGAIELPPVPQPSLTRY